MSGHGGHGFGVAIRPPARFGVLPQWPRRLNWLQKLYECKGASRKQSIPLRFAPLSGANPEAPKTPPSHGFRGFAAIKLVAKQALVFGAERRSEFAGGPSGKRALKKRRTAHEKARKLANPSPLMDLHFAQPIWQIFV